MSRKRLSPTARLERRFVALMISDPDRVLALAPDAHTFTDAFSRLAVEAARRIRDRGGVVETASLRDELGAVHFGSLMEVTRALPLDTPEGVAKLLRDAGEQRRREAFAESVAVAAQSGAIDVDRVIADATALRDSVGPAKKGPSPFDTLRLVDDAMIDEDPPEPRWLFTRPDPDVPDIEEHIGVMECGTVAMLPGLPGVGKSTIKLWAAVAIASGVPWLGWTTVETGPVVFATAEEGAKQVHRRINRLVRHLGLTDEQRERLRRHLWLWPLRGADVALTHERDHAYTATPFCEELLAWCAKRAPLAIILDPLSRFASADVEVDNFAGTAFVKQLERFSMLPSEPTILFTHHIGKQGGLQEHDLYTARGSSSLTGGVKWQANIWPIEGPQHSRWGVRVTVVKTNWAESPPRVWLKWSGGVLRVATRAERQELYANLARESAKKSGAKGGQA